MAEEPRPEFLHIIPHYSPVTNILTSFTVEDPEGTGLAKWRQYINDIHKEYPGVSKKELEDSKVTYYQYRALFVLGRASFTLDTLKGKPSAIDLTTPQRLSRYGVREEDFQKVIELDGKYNLEELRQICREHGLPLSGDKKKLVSRLLEAKLI